MSMMEIETYDPLPGFLWERLRSFEEDFSGKSWQDLYEATTLLQQRYPQAQFGTAPRLYLDLSRQRAGLLFKELGSDQLFFVYRCN